MEGYRYQDFMMIVITFLLAMMLTILPLPEFIMWWRPMWVLMVLFFWMIAEPDTIGVGSAFVVGLLMDLLLGTLFGEHALIYSLVAYIALRFPRQIRNFPLWQQTLLVMGLVFLSLLLHCWIVGIVDSVETPWQYWLPLFSSGLLWPWLYIVLSDYQQRYVTS